MTHIKNENNFELQCKYCEDVKKILKQDMGLKQPLAYVHTYGCQQNVSDGEKLKGMLSKMGYEFTDDEHKADLILFNTCAVREHAQDRVFGNVGALKHIKRSRPSVMIVLCGCMTEQEHVVEKIKESYPFVDVVFGTHSLHYFPQIIFESMKNKKRVFESGEGDENIYEDLPIRRDGKIKAWIPIMYGCNNFCSYCIVPYVRGRERSRNSDSIINEARELINSGYKDITLLGQNVNSYGKGLDEDINFAELLRRLDAIEGEYVIRFMTSHPKDATKELIDVIASSKHISSHLHLPFQSGNNRVLKEMNRKYTRGKYLEIINYAKSKIKDLSLTSDVIVGFPGETYDEFKDTLSLVQEVGFSSLFTFIYSPREGTPAAKFADPVESSEKREWMAELLKLQEGISADITSSMVGRTFRALVESKANKAEGLIARTSGNIIIETQGPSDLIGKFADIKIVDSKNWVLKGEII